MRKPLLAAAAVLCLVAGILTLVTAASLSRRDRQAEPVVAVRSAVEPVAASADWLTEYTLTERSGREFSSQELDGKVHVVNFFFSACPSICRMQSGKVQELAEEFGPEGVVFLSITCDPANDTPARLQTYADLFNADDEDWLFLTSTDMNYLRRVGAEVYQVPVDKQVHSERLLVVDQDGKAHGTYHWNKPEQMVEMRDELRKLLARGDAAPAADPAGTPAADEDADPAAAEAALDPNASTTGSAADALATDSRS